MAKRYRHRPRPINPAQQALWINRQPNWTCRLNVGGLVARGTVRPSELSQEYAVEIRYHVGNHPEVRVVSPKLTDRGDGQPVPHLYTDGTLCLYRPRYREWTPVDLISQTIIPWISEWLYFYELWLATGTWLGGGEHPGEKGRRPTNGQQA